MITLDRKQKLAIGHAKNGNNKECFGIKMIKELVALANKLDSLGLYKEADLIDLNLEKYFKKVSEFISTESNKYKSQNKEADTPENNAAWEKYIASTPNGLEVRNSWEIFADYTTPWETTYTDFVKWWKESMRNSSKPIGSGTPTEVINFLQSTSAFNHYKTHFISDVPIGMVPPKANPMPHIVDPDKKAPDWAKGTEKSVKTKETAEPGKHKPISKK